MQAIVAHIRSTKKMTKARGELPTARFAPWSWLDHVLWRAERRQRLALPRRAGGGPTSCKNWLSVGTAAAVTATMVLTLLTISTPPASGAALPACPVVAKWPVKPVTSDVVAVLKRYYTAKHLTPMTIYKNQEMVLNVNEQSVGVHYCKNPDGSKSGYVGSVPKNATAAVMVHVKHKPYPVTQAPSSFVTLAKIPRTGWKVVSEGTGP
jgi:hypothetical protein